MGGFRPFAASAKPTREFLKSSHSQQTCYTRSIGSGPEKIRTLFDYYLFCLALLARRMLGAERYEDFETVALCVVGLACYQASVSPYVDTVE